MRCILGAVGGRKLGRRALNRCDAPDPGVPCAAFCTGSSCRWRALLCVRDARRTLRSSCFSTNSQSCTEITTDQTSPTRTGPCWVRSRAALPRPQRAGWLVTPETLLRWHRRRPPLDPTLPGARAALRLPGAASPHHRHGHQQPHLGLPPHHRRARLASASALEPPPCQESSNSTSSSSDGTYPGRAGAVQAGQEFVSAEPTWDRSDNDDR